ncbi:hypothetical protein B0H14DRAFT_3429687 [Mycena olivaceomarginata]|nr:hypothetical protein B0H14DRAFT_3429687 [Mycena olivaceomarginata]
MSSRSSSQVMVFPRVHHFIALIKVPDSFPDMYAVSPNSNSLLSYTIQKLLATNPRRLFINTTQTIRIVASAYIPLLGVVSIVDILPFFAHLARLDVDPARMQRHHRVSCASTNPVHQVASEQPQQRRVHEPDSEVAADSVI